MSSHATMSMWSIDKVDQLDLLDIVDNIDIYIMRSFGRYIEKTLRRKTTKTAPAN